MLFRWYPLSFHPWIRFDTVSELLDLAEEHYEVGAANDWSCDIIQLTLVI